MFACVLDVLNCLIFHFQIHPDYSLHIVFLFCVHLVDFTWKPNWFSGNPSSSGQLK